MTFVFVRHGDKQPVPGRNDSEWPLAETARTATERLKQSLLDGGIRPDVLLTSSHHHARETADLLRVGEAPIIEVQGLTPTPETIPFFSLAAIVEEACGQGVDFDAVQTAIMVGHEDRLSNLARQMTTDEVVRLGRLEAHVLEAESLEAAIAKHATLTKRVSLRSLPSRNSS